MAGTYIIGLNEVLFTLYKNHLIATSLCCRYEQGKKTVTGDNIVIMAVFESRHFKKAEFAGIVKKYPNGRFP